MSMIKENRAFYFKLRDEWKGGLPEKIKEKIDALSVKLDVGFELELHRQVDKKAESYLTFLRVVPTVHDSQIRVVYVDGIYNVHVDDLRKAHNAVSVCAI